MYQSLYLNERWLHKRAESQLAVPNSKTEIQMQILSLYYDRLYHPEFLRTTHVTDARNTWMTLIKLQEL